MRPLKKSCGIEVDDVAKRLMDYGFHAPTMSFPIPGTLMVEPTESEPLAELDRFCDAMIAIREEIRAIEERQAPEGRQPAEERAAHGRRGHRHRVGAPVLARDGRVPRAVDARRTSSGRRSARLNNALGDRNLVCSCPPIEEYGD